MPMAAGCIGIIWPGDNVRTVVPLFIKLLPSRSEWEGFLFARAMRRGGPAANVAKRPATAPFR